MSTTSPSHCPASAATIVARVTQGLSAAERLCREALDRARAEPGIFWELDERSALADARAVDRRLADGQPVGPLAGLPIAVKDSFDVEGLQTRLGLQAPTHRAVADATVVERLRRAGAIVIGKTAMDQMAWSMTGQSPSYPPCANPVAAGCLPGGSSSGSAAAVAAGIVATAIGTDTAGSTRVPAAWCAVVGYKPSHGRVSMSGCAPVAPSADTIGVIATTVEDCALVAMALGANDPLVDQSHRPPPATVALGHGSAVDFTPDADSTRDVSARNGLTIGVMRELAVGGVEDTGVLAAWEAALRRLSTAGYTLRDIDVPLGAPGFGKVLAAEFAAEWEGRLDPATHAPGQAVRTGIEHGHTILAVDYLRARQDLDDAERLAREVFSIVDVIALPTVGLRPPAIGDLPSVARASLFTRSLGAFGWPAISIPCTNPAGDPIVALQLAGPPGTDAELLDRAGMVAAALRDHTVCQEERWSGDA